MNAAIIYPGILAAALIWKDRNWRDWVAFTFVASSLVELFQGIALPNREASMSDVVANTLGALGASLTVGGGEGPPRA